MMVVLTLPIWKTSTWLSLLSTVLILMRSACSTGSGLTVVG